MKKRLLSILMALALCLGLLPTVALAAEADVWDGTTVDTTWYNTKDTSFPISTGAELAGLAQIVNGTASGILKDSFAGKTVTLTNDIDLNLISKDKPNWTPIGTEDSPFQGKFDGGSQLIKKLGIEGTSNDQGLFGYIKDAEICNVTLNGVIVNGDTNIGGIAGTAVNSRITTCTVENSDEQNVGKLWGICGSESVGGIVGCSQDSSIQNSINKAYVYLLISGDEPARHKVGGIAGVATLSADACSEEDAVLIAGCTNTGKITCTTEANFQCTGGIVGRLVSDNADYRAIVKNCKNTGSVSSIEAGTGGIVGYAQNASIESCENENDITGTTGVGGIAGYAYYGTQILNCINSSSVTGKPYSSTDTTVYPYNIGGIVGSIYNPRDTTHLEGDCDSLPVYSYNTDSLISNCTNRGDVTCNFEWSEVEPIVHFVDGVPYAIDIYGSFVGGIAGMAVDSAYFDEEGNVVRIEYCTNDGDVTAGKTYVGGVLGIGKNADVVGCTNSGTVDGADDFDSDSIRADIGAYSYTVWFDANGGAVKAEDTLKMAAYGVLDSLPVPTHSGYTFVGWFTAAEGGDKVTTETVFDKDTTIYAHWTAKSSGSGGSSTYAITLESAENGTVTMTPRNASKGATVTLTVNPDKGYTLETLTVTDRSGNEIELTDKGDGRYTFKMPGSKVTVTATFMEDNTMLNFFVDVFPGDYYYDAVLWAAENDITGGVDDTHFAPNAPCTRAQIVTFLWRAAGSPEPESLSSLSDVPADAYYAKAVAWALENGITTGTGDGMFSPDATCTRAQAMTFIYRYEQAQGGGMQGEWMFRNPFTDVDLENYFGEAVMWAVANGITNGTSDTTFSPGADCTRAQIVTFLYHFFVK